jgi:hypothetical protein
MQERNFYMSARNTDPETSHDALDGFSEKADKIDDRVIELTRATRGRGATQAEIVYSMPEHRPGSITPRFVWLVRKGLLVRVQVGTGKPTKHFPCGRPEYITRVDPSTGFRAIVHWVPEFAPSPEQAKEIGNLGQEEKRENFEDSELEEAA